MWPSFTFFQQVDSHPSHVPQYLSLHHLSREGIAWTVEKALCLLKHLDNTFAARFIPRVTSNIISLLVSLLKEIDFLISKLERSSAY